MGFDRLRYGYQSLIPPPSVLDYDTHAGKSTLLKQNEVLGGYDPSSTSPSACGPPRVVESKARSPTSTGKDRRDGKSPLILYAYGTYGIRHPAQLLGQSAEPARSGHRLAIAHVRGGDEMGEQWREDGMLMKKKNTFSDFIDSAEYLIKESGLRLPA